MLYSGNRQSNAKKSYIRYSVKEIDKRSVRNSLLYLSMLSISTDAENRNVIVVLENLWQIYLRKSFLIKNGLEVGFLF